MKPVRAILAVAIVGLAALNGGAPRAQGKAAVGDLPAPSLPAMRPDSVLALAQGPGGQNPGGARGEGRENRESRRGPREADGPLGGPGMGPGGPGGPGGSGGERDPMGPELMNDIIKVAHDYDPELGNRLEDIRKKNPERLKMVIGNHGPNLMRLVYLSRNNPEMYKMRIEEFKLNRESEDIAKQIREGGNDKPKTEKLRQQLRAKVTEQFTQRQKIRERELGDLEKRIEELRTEIRSRKEKQAELIAEREKELIEKPVKTEW